MHGRRPRNQQSNRTIQWGKSSVRRDKLKGNFEAILHAMQPREDLHTLACAMFKDAWNQRLTQAKQALTSLKTTLAKPETQIEQLLERIVEADNATVIRAYEVKLAKLEKEKLLKAEKIANSGQSHHGFDELFELALHFLANP